MIKTLGLAKTALNKVKWKNEKNMCNSCIEKDQFPLNIKSSYKEKRQTKIAQKEKSAKEYEQLTEKNTSFPKRMKMCSIFLILRDAQMETTLRWHSITHLISKNPKV